MSLPVMNPAHCVFVDVHDVVHARHFEPETVCGRNIILAMMGGSGGKTVQWSPRLCPTIPSVTCIICLTAMDD